MKAYLYTLVAIIFATISLSAQTVWLGNTDQDWQNSDNWSAGVPTPGMTITIPGTPQGGNFPIFSGGPVIDYTIQNAGTITFNTLVYNNGSIINFGGANIMIDGQFFNAGAGLFDNDGILNVNAAFTNYGTFDTALSGEVNIAASATFTHAGLFFKAAGPFINNGSVVNSSNMRCTNIFENFGSLNNLNSFEAPFGSTFNNHASGSISNPSGSIFVINGAFLNDSPFTNGGEFQLQSATIGTNNATITNDMDFDVSGSLVNAATIQNNSTIRIKDGGTLTNNSNLNNSGLITLAICGTLVQNAGNTIAAPVENDGLIYLLNGDVQWTNIEFGNEFTDLSNTKPPVAGCFAGIFVNLDANGQASITASQIDKGSYGACGAGLNSVTADITDFTTADLGSNVVTLTVVDNLGTTSTCQSIVTILPYVAPINPIDDADITFNCPDDVLVTTLPGARSAPASWTEPTDATSNCAGSSACVTRTSSNTTQCSSGDVYGFYLKLANTSYYYSASNGVLTEYDDGTATYTAHVTNNADNNYQFDLSVDLGGRTFTAPGAPKANHCIAADDSNWYYYTSTTGTLTGTNGMAGALISLTRIGEAFQLGNGANATDGTNAFGASGWLDGQVVNQPTNGTNISIAYGNNPQAADINIMLSGDGNECRPMSQCSSQDNIPGFIFMGEFNNSKYYCSNTNDFTWAAGKALAEANGGHLAIVDDMAENNFLQQNIIASWAWIGLTDEAVEGTWRWTNGEISNFYNWNSGEPNNGGGIENYARILKSNGKWTDRNASFLAEVIMEIPCSNSAPSCANVSDNISGFTFLGEYNDAKYYASHNASSWNTAKADCEANGGYLVAIGDQAENDFIQTNINPASGSIWTGLNTVGTPNDFQWANGEAVGYTNWLAGEPNGGGVDHAARLVKSHGEWTDRATSVLFEYVMEIPCAGSTGPSGPPTITQIRGPQNGDDFAVGITEVAYEITDDCGNQEICIFDVTVEQTPSDITYINCPGDITINTEPGATSAPITWNPVNATTNCYNDGLTVEQALGPQIGDVQRAKDGAQLVVYQAVDSCGNFAVCAFNVTVVATPSAITMNGCSADIDVQADQNQNAVAVSWDAPTGSTNCFTGLVNVDQLEGPASGSDFAVGTSTRIIYLVSDECGNTEICIFNVNVSAPSCPAAGTACDDGDNDTFNDVEDGNCNCAGENSVVTYTNCSDDLIFYTDPGATGAIVTFSTPGFSTNCPSGTSGNVQVTGGTESGTVYPIGQYTLEFSFADYCGQGAICSFNITVIEVLCTDDDNDGICAADDCDDNDANFPMAAGTACDDGDATTENDVIGADGCSCAGITIDPCANAGGDMDGDGICAADDCDDNDPNFPMAAGTACDDGDATTENDVIGADGCSCAGTTIDPCASAGGDMDGDGVCAADDCDDNDPNFPMAAGTACDDGDATTENDMIGADGCSCEGTPISSGPDCNNIVVTPGVGQLTISGLGQVNVTAIQIFDSSWDRAFRCFNDCEPETQVVVLPEDTYYVKVGLYTDDYQLICEIKEYHTVLGGDPCATAGGDMDGDGVCAADDCDDNDPNFPMAAGTACDDGDANTVNDVIGADGCSCAGTVPTDPCANAGGDMDGDGVCAADDCDDNDPNFPMAAGTACDDGDATTVNDVIGADGCSCAGTPSNDPCANAGGDMDGDGVCAADDCDDNDPNFPMVVGTACDDGDANTINDEIQGDGCTCAGTSTGPDCGNVSITAGDGFILVEGLDGAPVTSLQVFDGDWEYVFKCTADCNPTESISGLSAGTYYVKVAFFTASWQKICEVEDYYIVTSGNGDPCASLGGDADGDGVCAANDCDDNDANFPMAAGTSCNDGDADTENDVILADGCTCEGTPPVSGPDCGLVTIIPGFESLTISGLTAPVTGIQVFDASWNRVFKCAGDCDPDVQVINGLTNHDIYFVKVSFFDASWNKICDVEGYYKIETSLGGDDASNRRMLEFQASKGPRQVDLLWGSNTGDMNDYFEIQRSPDGKHYETILMIPNKYETAGFQTYLDKDTQPYNGVNYYRMKQVHNDGTYVFTGERKVVFEDDFNQFTIFPNPTADEVYIHLKSYSGLPVNVEFYDALGRMVHTRFLRNAPEVPLPFDVSDFNEGTYMVSVKYKGKKRVTQRLVIIKE